MSNVAVGMPVYNGADTIEEALRCLLDGTYRDIEIIVSDNNSTDGTAEIVSKISAEDGRVTLFQQPTNIGPVGNFRFVAEQATSTHFLWRAHDDVSDCDYVEKLLAKLKEVPAASLAAPHTVTSKLKGDKPRPFKPRLSDQQTAKWCMAPKAEAGWFYGLYRTQTAQEAVAYTHKNYPHVWGWDFLVVLYALLGGGVLGCNDTRFMHRSHGRPTNHYNFSKQHLKRIAMDFFAVGTALAEAKGLSGAALLIFKVRLWQLILRRVARWQRFL